MNNNNDKNNIVLPRKQTTTIKLCNENYLVDTFFSMKDMEDYHIDLHKNTDSKRALCKIIFDKIQISNKNNLSLELIYSEKGEAFEQYINAIIEQEHKLQEIYNRTDTTLNIFERFAIAINKYLSDINQNLTKIIQPYQKILEQLNKKNILTWTSQLQETFDGISNVYQQINIANLINENLIQSAKTFSDIFSKIHISSYTEEELNKMSENYIAWGKLGWTIIPNTNLDLFDEIPASPDECIDLALNYLKEDDMVLIFSDLRKSKVKKDNLESAIYCFEKMQYSACALLLFASIDSILITLQPITNNGQWRKSGLKAISKYNEKFKGEQEIGMYLYIYLCYINLIECLNAFFKEVPNFLNEPSVINRNFICHGMNEKIVSKTDCIQLFLALYNLTELVS